MEKRITELKWINERQERKNRKNNIVIKGADLKLEKLKQEVEEYIKECLKVEVMVKKASKIRVGKRKNVVIAEIEEWEQKRQIMTKNKEPDRSIIIENDLTRKEREIQQELRRMTREEREKGRDRSVRIGYKKICLKGR